MEGTNAATLQEAKAPSATTAPRIRLRSAVLGRLFERDGVRGYRERAKQLGVGTGTLSRACSGDTELSPAFIDAVLTRFPEVPFEKLFAWRGQADADRSQAA